MRRLAGVADLHEYARYPDPLSPAAAARLSGLPPLDFDDTVRRIRSSRPSADTPPRRLVLVEGAGGLLVRTDEDGRTLADLAHALKAPVLLVAHPNLGTLNIAALTLEAMAARGLDLAGIVLGSWPAEPDLADAQQHPRPGDDRRPPAGRRAAGRRRAAWTPPSSCWPPAPAWPRRSAAPSIRQNSGRPGTLGRRA